MTLYELLHQISFDEIVPFVKSYHGWNALPLYKVHYDYLRHLTPRLGENTIITVCNDETDESWPEPHLHAHPLEGDFWEESLAKELVIEPDVKASLAEIAMCCLWHTSFYGFTEEDTKETAERLEYYANNFLNHDITRIRAKKEIREVQDVGGNVPSPKEFMQIPSFRKEVRRRCKNFKLRRKGLAKHGFNRISMRCFAHRSIRSLYYERIWTVAEVVRAMLKSPMCKVEDLRSVFLCNHAQCYNYITKAYDAKKRVEWRKELIEKYEAFCVPTLENCVLCIGTSSDHPLLVEEMNIVECIASKCTGSNSFYIYTDDNLGEEMCVTTMFYC